MWRVYRKIICILICVLVFPFIFQKIYLNLVEKQHNVARSQSTAAMFLAVSGYTKRTNSIQSRASIFHCSPLGWEQWDGFCSGNVSFEKAVLNTPEGLVPIFIHNVWHDRWVSYFIKEKGVWEAELVNLIHHFLSLDEDLNLIDIGSHIGEFSLLAAKLGRQAIAVDPLYENVQRLCKSIEVNNFSHLVKVFYTALSDSRSRVSFIRHSGNVGGTSIKGMDSFGMSLNTTISSEVKVISPPSLTLNDKNTATTVLLDDLLPFVAFKKAFIKMDVEGHENYVLNGGEQFFSAIDVRYVLMEWTAHNKDSRSGRQIVAFLRRHGFSPSKPTILKKTFKENEGNNNIFWIKE
ncbi:hypothetical protein LOTGIDRAFT_172344 [Lottia gigantea]|uniref:Methyltransferase FkbM domain-containing protein n=1 Tax=Lottia gigantea TaxID=225164 RepID=V4B864_LOTGI|nr:hypothetical protein LOTGIDRAFT_172344 [Lottia gigantea]ESP01877.1 hypothetical protein LOTGIDRAFT_172344 [Lottia gigantea]